MTYQERWDEIKQDLTLPQLRVLDKVWYKGGKLTPDEEKELRAVFEEHPLGEVNFGAWLRQTLRQTQENAALEQAREQSLLFGEGVLK